MATAVEGIGLGVLGIGLPDIVIWVGVLLRGVFETSMASGEEWKMLNLENDRYIDRNVVYDENELKQQIEKTANAFATEMLVTKFVQGLPIVGVLGGVANPIYYQRIMRYVQLKYRKRYLLRKS